MPCEAGKPDVDGVRNPLRGVVGPALLVLGLGGETPLILFRVFPTGRAGSADDGGPIDDLGKAAAMVSVLNACLVS